MSEMKLSGTGERNGGKGGRDLQLETKFSLANQGKRRKSGSSTIIVSKRVKTRVHATKRDFKGAAQSEMRWRQEVREIDRQKKRKESCWRSNLHLQ